MGRCKANTIFKLPCGLHKMQKVLDFKFELRVFHNNFIFGSTENYPSVVGCCCAITVLEFSLNTVDCVSGRVFRK